MPGLALAAAMLVSASLAARADEPASRPPDAEAVRFFENRIRPVLVKHCYECHSARAKTLQGGLLLDTRAGVRTGGDSGPAIVPGQPQASLLLEALRYESFEMPPTGKLPPAVIADFEHWIRSGAADPRHTPAPAPASAGATPIDFEAARRHWAFQPIGAPVPPEVSAAAWPASP
ncbi:MAG TPA: c-type cytochrome domain-containing protein, partial [Planctomycetaceae bacterium]|nr:c-type cytochrome domain-containing protein [Planctomycetaceae bacterium]